MTFRERSAWAMAGILLVTGLAYLWMVNATPGAPVQEMLVPYVFCLIVLSIGVQVFLALRSPREATLPADERERMILDKSGKWSGAILAIGVVLAGMAFVAVPNGNMLFHHILFALIIAQIANYALQIALLRKWG